MLCAVCGHKNPPGARNCAVCGTSLGLSTPGNPVSSGPGIATGGTSVPSAPSNVYSPFLTKGVRLQSGSYAVGEVLGQGGFGITYKGGDLSLRRYVALKEFFPQGCTRQGNTVLPMGGYSAEDYTNVKSKFIEEARTLGRFNDPGIVKVYGVFEENNTAYMVMEFLEGKTLSKRMSEVGMMDEAEAIGIIKKVGAALSVVHNSGLIHRDIKPDNICLTDDGRVVLIDFGTARSFATGKTVKQTTMLTPGYAPLEQYGQQARFGSYTDIYALAATFYHALTGQVPPQATDRATGVDLKPPHELNPKVSRSVSQAIVWAMQVKADQRPQSVSTFLDALQGAAPLKPAMSQGPQNATVLVDPNYVPPQVMPQVGQPAPPPANFAVVQQIAENQLLTNADPSDALAAVVRSFESLGVVSPTFDTKAMRAHGTTGTDVQNWSHTLVGQITQDVRGTIVTLHATPAAGVTDVGRSVDEVRKLGQTVTSALRTIRIQPPPPPPVAPAQPYSPRNYKQPTPYMPRMQGSSVLSTALSGVLCCPISAPVAWIRGNQALAEYGNVDPGDRILVHIGRAIGIITTIFWAIILTAIFLGGSGGN